MDDGREAFHRSLEEWEPKWMSFSKLSICYVVIHVNSSFFILLKERILGEFMFPCPLFLVFASQLMSLFVASIICIVRRHQFTQQRHLEFWKPKMYIRKMPLIQFALMALSDSVGRSLQIETRRTEHNISFPLRIFIQSYKTIPVMILGVYLLNIRYKFRDYVDISLISLFIALFILYARESTSTSTSHHIISDQYSSTHSSSSVSSLSSYVSPSSTFSGVVMIVIYTLCDSFTLQWQMRLYNRFQIDQYTVMLWLNACQLIVVGGVLLFSGDGIIALAHLTSNANCIQYIFILAVLSTISQLLILYLIRRFGPIVYTVLINSKNLINIIFSSVFICGLGIRSSMHCLNLYMLICRPIPLLSSIGAIFIIGSKAYHSPPLAIEMRSAPAEVGVV